MAANAYCDLDGVIVAEKVRFEPMSFKWRIPDDGPGKGFSWGLHGAVPGLYRWRDLVDSRRVLLVEGEKARMRSPRSASSQPVRQQAQVHGARSGRWTCCTPAAAK